MATSDAHGPNPPVGESATAIASAVCSGETSAVEVTKRHLEWIERTDESIGAFLLTTPEWALETAEAVDRAVAGGKPNDLPLAGVPLSIKDVLCTEGIPTTCGSRILEGWRPPYTATAVRRALGAGAVPLGKVNMDEFAMGSSTENSAFHPTRNPWDLERVPGGSSGGSAASVAAFQATVSLGSDTGGSIRQPAAFCGIVGLKPTYGAVSRYGLVAFASSLDQVGPMARCVRDAALLFDVVRGHDPADSTSIPDRIVADKQPRPKRSLPWSKALAEIAEDSPEGSLKMSCTRAIEAALAAGPRCLEGLRLGVVSELSGEAVDASVSAALRRTLDVATELGAAVEEVSLPSFEYALSAYYLIAPAEASSNLARYDGVRYGLRVPADTVFEMMERTRAKGFGPEVKRRIMLGTYALSSGYYEAYYGTALKVRTLVSSDFSRAFDHFDLLISATTPTTAFKLGEKVSDPLAMYLSDLCTIPANLAGIPAVSIPVDCDSQGLPIGVQLMAPVLGEVLLLAVAACLEAAVEFAVRPPAVMDFGP